MLEQLLISAIHKFEFPRVRLDEYEIQEIEDATVYNGIESDHEEVPIYIYQQGEFLVRLTQEEINILATYMIVEWLGYQLASIENTRLKYSGQKFCPLFK